MITHETTAGPCLLLSIPSIPLYDPSGIFKTRHGSYFDAGDRKRDCSASAVAVAAADVVAAVAAVDGATAVPRSARPDRWRVAADAVRSSDH